MEIYIYSADFQLQGVIDSFSSFRWRRRYFEPGEFELHVAATPENLTILAEDSIVHRLDRKEAGIIEGIEIDESDDGDTMTITGRFLSSNFENRFIVSTLNYSGTVETAMRQIVSDNAITDRPLNGLVLGTLNNFTPMCNFQATGKAVVDVVEALSKSSTLGYRVRYDVPEKALVFETYQGVDRTVTQTAHPYVLFSSTFNNISSPQYTMSKKGYKNFAYVAGEGTGDARTIVTVDQTNGAPLRELWVDARDLQQGDLSDDQYKAQLTQRGIEKLAEAVKSESFESAAVNTENFEYRTDWDLGDIVSFEKWGILLNQRVTEVEEVYESGIETVTPTCGTPLPETLDLTGSDT
jgi:hypothetical protein